MTEDEAKKRFFTLGMVRLTGVASALIGIAILVKRWIEPAEIIGWLLIVNGIVDVIVIPPILIRSWKRRDP